LIEAFPPFDSGAAIHEFGNVSQASMQHSPVSVFLAILFVIGVDSDVCKNRSNSCAADDADPGESLLASHFGVDRSLMKVLSSDGHHQEVASWIAHHRELAHAADDGSVTLDEFMAAQQASGDACSSRLLEAKRSLDGLLHDLKSLGMQVEDHMTVLEVETQNLKATELSIEAVEDQYHEGTIKCDEEREKALADLAQYSAELKELTQIAEPSVRYQHVVTVEGMPEGNATSGENATSALLDVGTWTKKSCEAFVAYAKEHKKMNLLQDQSHTEEEAEGPRKRKPASPIQLNCDQQRNKLQRIFTKAYNAVKDLKKDAKDRSEDRICQETADAKRASLLVPLVAQREQATSRIEYSGSALAALEPVLALVQNRVDKLQNYIESKLQPECEEASEVSKYLQNVRDLIISLQNCPGKDDFALEIPTDKDPQSNYFQKCFDASFGKICGTRMRTGGKNGNGHYVMTSSTARQACKDLDGQLCSKRELKLANEQGVQWCSWGFLTDNYLHATMQESKEGCPPKGLVGPNKPFKRKFGNAWCCYLSASQPKL